MINNQYDQDQSILAAKRTWCELGHLPLCQCEKATQKGPLVCIEPLCAEGQSNILKWWGRRPGEKEGFQQKFVKHFCWPQLPFILLVQISECGGVVWRHLDIVVKGRDDKRDASHVTAMCERGSKRSRPRCLSIKVMSCFSPLLPICALDGSHQCGGGGVSREAMPTIENPLKQSFSHLLGLMTGLNCAEQQCSVLTTG